MKTLKKLSVIFLAFSLSIILIACGSQEPTTQNTESTSQEQTSVDKVIDREGKEITLPEKADTIISLAPSITETLVNLGLGDKLIAVDKYSLQVEGVNKELPVFDIMNPDAENIVNLKPDVIFGTGMSKTDGKDPFAPMIEMGTFVTVIPTSTSIQGIIDDIKFIGKVTKTEEKANEIVENYQNEIKEITDKIKEAKIEEAPLVYFETSPLPNAYTFGSNVFLNDMINILGAKNIFSDEEGWISVSEEQVIAKNPTVIFTNEKNEDAVKNVTSRQGWEVIDAVKNNKVYVIDKNSSARANENSIKAFKEMAKNLYPDLFSE